MTQRTRGRIVNLDTIRIGRGSVAPGGKVTLSLPFPISVNSMFGQASRHQRYPMPRYKIWKDEASARLREQKPGRITGPVHLHYTFAFKSNADLANYEKGVTDILVSEGVIIDDTMTIVRSISLDWSEEVEGVLIEIIALPTDQQRVAA